MANTLSEIDKSVVSCLSIQSDSTTYNKESYRTPKINAVLDQICKGWYKDIRNENTYRGGDLVFLRKQVVYTVKQKTVTTSDINIGDTTISVNDTSNYLSATIDSPQYLIVNNNIIKYTGMNTTQFTGVSLVQLSIKSGSPIRQLYKIPTDFWKPYMLTNTRQIGNSQDRVIEIPNCDFRRTDRPPCYYSIIGDNTLQLLDIISGVGDYWFYYYMTPSSLVSDNDVCILPGSYAIEVLAPLVAGELLRETEANSEGNEAMNKLALGYSKLEVMYKQYAEVSKELRPKVLYKGTKTFINNSTTNRWQ